MGPWKGSIKHEIFAELLAALACGKATPKQQKEAGSLLENLTSRRRGVVGERSGFAFMVDYFRARRKLTGKDASLESALIDAREMMNQETGKLLSEETLRDYYREGVREMARSDAQFAREIEALARRPDISRSQDPIDHALYESAHNDQEHYWMDRIPYERGRRSQQKLPEKK